MKPSRRLRAARLSSHDVLRLGGHGLRARPLRVVLSALGIAIGIAAMVAVAGISASSRARLDQQLDALGTNLLTAGPGSTLFGAPAKLAEDAVAMVGRIEAVESVSAIGSIGGAVAAALVIGALAGLYPAIRAARLAPTEALATT